MKLTDFITGEDVVIWLRDEYRTGKTIDTLCSDIFGAHDKEIFDLRNTLAVVLGCSPGETGAILSFLDAAIQHKSKVTV